MIEGLIGKKIGMTSVFVEGADVPVTVIEAPGCFVTQVKASETDGYAALQLGFLEKKESRTNSASKGHAKKAGTPAFYHVKEFGGEGLSDDYKLGQKVEVIDLFKAGDFVDVTSKSKGKGFTGVVKRWGFKGGPASHGSKHGRTSGSVGQGSSPSKVFKGMKMSGQHGNANITIQNLKVVDVREKEKVILIKGAVPGAIGAVVVIKKALKK